MPGLVKVEDFEVFRLFRVALLKFAQAAGESLSSADSEIAGTRSWVENEQATFWQGQFRKRTEAVAKARDAVRQKKLYKDSSGRIPGAVEEEKELAKCMRAVEHAQEKIELVRRALPRLEKESELYRGGVARLSGCVTGDVPRAVALLDRLAASLEEYVHIEAPSAGVPESVFETGAGETMARGGEMEPPKVEEAKAPEGDSAPKKEGGDVADGK